MTNVNDAILYQSFTAKKVMSGKIAECLQGRFMIMKMTLNKHMKWLVHIDWGDDKKYVLDDMENDFKNLLHIVN